MKFFYSLLYYLFIKPLMLVMYFFGAFCALIAVGFKGGYMLFMTNYRGAILKGEIEK